MRKETVICKNLFTEEEETHDLYFHLTEAEITMLNAATDNKIFDFDKVESSEEKVALFEKIISKAYGQKTADGKFIKDDIARKEFLCSPQYSALLMKFLKGEEKIEEFILGCLPRDISRQIKLNEDGTISTNKE